MWKKRSLSKCGKLRKLGGGLLGGWAGGRGKKREEREDTTTREEKSGKFAATRRFFFFWISAGRAGGRVICASIDGSVDWSIDALVDRRGRVAPFFFSLFLRWKISQCVSNGTRADERKRQKTERKETDRRAIAGRRTSWKRQRERC